MTTAPASLKALAAYWTAQGGRSLGIVGDTSHTSGYHLGKDRIYDGAGPGLGDGDYSVQRPRDVAGLTNDASAIDLGRLNGTLADLQKFSRWLVEQCFRGAPGTRDIREVIYSPDGEIVLRWDQVDDHLHTGPGQGDGSHTTHTHISYFRDSAARDKTGVFRPYFEQPAADGTPYSQQDLDEKASQAAAEARTATKALIVAAVSAIEV